MHVARNTWTVWLVHFVDRVGGKLVSLIANIIYAEALCCAVAISYHPPVLAFSGAQLPATGRQKKSNLWIFEVDQNFHRYTEHKMKENSSQY